jgi:type I restriction-modification system DNA methylase subunit
VIRAMVHMVDPALGQTVYDPCCGAGGDAQKSSDFETGATQVLFVQDILSELAPNGTCGMVLDEGLLFRTNGSAFVETKRKLLDECDLWAIVSLPGGVFSIAVLDGLPKGDSARTCHRIRPAYDGRAYQPAS